MAACDWPPDVSRGANLPPELSHPVRRRFRVVDEVVELQAPGHLHQVIDSLYADAPVSIANTTLSVRIQIDPVGFGINIDGEAAGHAENRATLYEFLQRELTYALLDRLSPRFLLVHAGAVQIGTVCLLLPGNHDSGKSSLSYELGKHGKFYSDDVTPLHPATRCAIPFERELVLHAGTRTQHPGLPRPVDCAHFTDYDYLSARATGLCWAEPMVVSGLVFPQRATGSVARIIDVPPAETARRLLEQCFDLERLGVGSVDAVADLATRPAVEAHFDRASDIMPALRAWAADQDRIRQA